MSYKHLIWTIICFGYCCSFGQIAVNGTVREKRGKAPLEGVAVVVKGTTIGVLTDSQGEFEILIPTSDSMLVFESVGFVRQAIVIKEPQTVDILLKEDCIIDHFYYPKIGLYYFGGIKQSPTGLLADLLLPYAIGPTIQLTFGYQTDLADNRQIYSELRVRELLETCEYSLDLSAQYHRIIVKDPNFDFKSFKASSRLEKVVIDGRYAPIFMGIGFATRMIDTGLETYPGYELGFGYPLPLWIEAYAKTTYWTQYWQFQAGLEWYYRRYNVLFFYNRIAGYEEFNVGIGYDIRVKWEGKP